MRKHELYLPELVLIGATRGMLGAGIGLLVANQLSKDHRRIAGTVLVAVGALSTIPLAVRLFRRTPAEGELGADGQKRSPAAASSMMTH